MAIERKMTLEQALEYFPGLLEQRVEIKEHTAPITNTDFATFVFCHDSNRNRSDKVPSVLPAPVAPDGSVTFTTDGGEEFTTNNKRYIAFICDMEGKGFAWRTYSGRGMYGKLCPAMVTSRRDGISEQDIHRATRIRLKRDDMGLDTVLYVG